MFSKEEKEKIIENLKIIYNEQGRNLEDEDCRNVINYIDNIDKIKVRKNKLELDR